MVQTATQKINKHLILNKAGGGGGTVGEYSGNDNPHQSRAALVSRDTRLRCIFQPQLFSSR